MAGRELAKVAGTRRRVGAIRTRLPLFHTDRAGRIVEWNVPAEELSGVPAGEAVGQSCWEVIRGRDGTGGVVCHPGCSVMRLAREGWPASCPDLHVKMPSGVERLAVSTIIVGAGDDAFVLHPLQVASPGPEVPGGAAPTPPDLTPRQREILALLVDGLRVNEIASRLSLSVATVRNHVHALLRQLEVSSQLAAVAKARKLGLY
jgi:DNA-binding CsgD family transcriptional regulator